MKKLEILFDDIITQEIIDKGSFILLASRPGVGKTRTCFEIVNKYNGLYNYLYFDLSGYDAKRWFKTDKNNNVIYDYCSSLDIVKTIENEIKNKKIKFIVIDYWQLVEDTNEWFVRKLREISYHHKIVFIITSLLDRKSETRKSHLPLTKELGAIKGLSGFMERMVVVANFSLYNFSLESKLSYFLYQSYLRP